MTNSRVAFTEALRLGAGGRLSFSQLISVFGDGDLFVGEGLIGTVTHLGGL